MFSRPFGDGRVDIDDRRFLDGPVGTVDASLLPLSDSEDVSGSDSIWNASAGRRSVGFVSSTPHRTATITVDTPSGPGLANPVGEEWRLLCNAFRMLGTVGPSGVGVDGSRPRRSNTGRVGRGRNPRTTVAADVADRAWRLEYPPHSCYFRPGRP